MHMEASFVIMDQILKRLENASAHIAMDETGRIEASNAQAVALFAARAE